MARSDGDTLTLGDLGYATGTVGSNTSSVSFNNITGGTSEVSLDDYGIDSVNSTIDIIDEDSDQDESTAENYEINFGAAGSDFLATLGSDTGNFTWSDTLTGTFTSADYLATYTSPAVTKDESCTLSVTFADDYNHHATRYNTAVTVAITVIDTYGGGGGGEPGGGGCFALGTKILLSNGTEAYIEDIKNGDKVMAFNMPGMPIDAENDDEWGTYKNYTTSSISEFTTEESTVYNVWFDYQPEYYEIYLDNGKVLTITEKHPIFVLREGTYQWAQTKDVKVTDLIIDSDKQTVSITKIECIEDELETCNIDVEPQDVYFANGILVHNKGP